MIEKTWIDTVWPLKPFSASSAKQPLLTSGWLQCASCQKPILEKELSLNHWVCHLCGHHHRMRAHDWVAYLSNGSEVRSVAEGVQARDCLRFSDRLPYKDRLVLAKKKAGIDEAVVCVETVIISQPVLLSVFDFHFIGGSMGYAVGERLVQAIHTAIAQSKPFVCITASGGARMQEGVVGLFQMAKVSMAVAKLKRQGLPFIALLTDPTSGGVAASIAMQADIIVAEKSALIGFTGARVIAQTLKQKLPNGFQRAEFLLESGAVDRVVHRHEVPEMLNGLLMKLLRNVSKIRSERKLELVHD